MKKIVCWVLVLANVLGIASVAQAERRALPVLSESVYETNQIIVKYKEGHVRKRRANMKGVAIRAASSRQSPYEYIEVASIDDMDNILYELNASPDVDYAVVDDLLTLQELTPAEIQASLSQFREDGSPYTGKGAAIAVLDTGMNTQLSFIKDSIYRNSKETAANGEDEDGNGYADDITGWNFVDDTPQIYQSAQEDDHGTQIAGILSAVAPDAALVPLKIFKGTKGYVSDAIRAIEYAKAMGIRLFNCSWGTDSDNLALREAMSDSRLLFICAGGNMDDKHTSNVSYPAAFGLPNVVSVGSVNESGKASAFNKNGLTHQVYALGENLSAINAQGLPVTVNGTSYAAALVTGTVAAAQELAPGLGMETLSVLLKCACVTPNGLPLLNPAAFLEAALPYAGLEDADGRLSLLTGIYGAPLPPSVLKLWAKAGELTGAQKSEVLSVLSLDEAAFDLPVDVIGSLIIACTANRFNIAQNQAYAVFEAFEDYHAFYRELSAFFRVKETGKVSVNDQALMLKTLSPRYTVSDLLRSYMFSQAMALPLRDVLGEYILQNTGEPDEPHWRAIGELMQTYRINYQTAESVLKRYDSDAFLVELQVHRWRAANNLDVSDNHLRPYALPALYKNEFNKYKVPDDNQWTYGDFSVAQIDGMVSYQKELFDIPVRGGVSLALGVRYDPEMADAVVRAKNADELSHTYTRVVTNKYYRYVGGNWVYQPDLDEITQSSYTDAEFDPSWIEAAPEEIIVTPGVLKYQRIVQVHAQAGGDYLREDTDNYYDRLYGAGTGIGLSLPSMEVGAKASYLHLSDGDKYKILSDGGAYRLEGYAKGDCVFAVVGTAAFSSHGVQAAYQFSIDTGVTQYFDAVGRYLGEEDQDGNRVTVRYNAQGKIDRITEPAGRYIQFTYQQNGSQRDIQITFFDSDETQSRLLYTITSVKTASGEAYCLSRITDGAGTEIQYQFDLIESGIFINGRSSADTTTLYNESVRLVRVVDNQIPYTVTYDTCQTLYGPASCRQYARASQIAKHTNRNVVSFTYQVGVDVGRSNAGTTFWNYQSNSLSPVPTALYGYTTMSRNSFRDEKKFDIWKYNTGGRTMLGTQVQEAYSIPDRHYTGQIQTILSTKKDIAYSYDSDGRLLSVKETQNGTPLSQTVYTYNGRFVHTPSSTIQYNERMEHGGIKKTMTQNNMDNQRIIAKVVQSFVDTNNNNRIDSGEEAQEQSRTAYTYDSYGNTLVVTTDDKVANQSTVQENTYDSRYHTYVCSEKIPQVLSANGSTYAVETKTEYNFLGQKTAEYDANNHKVTYEYDASGNVVSTRLYEWNGSSHVLRTTGTVEYDHANKTYIQKNMGRPWIRFSSDAYGNAKVEESADGGQTYILKSEEFYDAFDRKNRERTYTADGNYLETRYVFDDLDRTLSETRYLFKKQADGYTQELQLQNAYTYETDVPFHSSTARYDKQTVVQKDKNNAIVSKSASYSNAFGVVYTETWVNPDASTPDYTNTTLYDDYGVVKSQEGDSIVDKTFTYDIRGRLYETRTEDMSYGTVTYNGLGTVQKKQDPMGSLSEYYYDNLGREIQAKTPFELVGMVLHKAETETYYDAMGNVVKTRTRNNDIDGYSSWTVTETEYNYQGNPVVVRCKGPPDSVTQYVYDALGQLVREYRGLTSKISIPYTYNADGSVSIPAYIDNGDYAVTKYEYDIRGNLTAMVDPLGKRETYRYDNHNRLILQVLRNGKAIQYEYDEQGHVVKKQAGALSGSAFVPAATVLYEYNKDGLLSYVSNGVSTNRFTYDSLGRLLKEEVTGGYEKTYTYSGKGCTSFTVRNSGGIIKKEAYTYDAKGRLSRIINGEDRSGTGPQSSSSIVDYKYDANDNIIRREIANIGTEMSQNFTYNAANLMKSTYFHRYYEGNTPVETYTYRLDGNLTEKHRGDTYTRYTYDSLGRLASEQREPGKYTQYTIQYEYDSRDNRIVERDLSFPDYPVSTRYTYDKADRLQSFTVQGTTGTFEYDDAGNLLVADGSTYQYDAFDRLSSYQYPYQPTVTFQYDGLDNRFSKTYKGNVTRHLWDRGNIAMDIVNGSATYSFVHGQFMEGFFHGDTMYVNEINHHNDVVTTYNLGTESITGSYRYNAFGLNAPTETVSNPYSYSGEYADSETGLQYLRGRYYSPVLGRFTQEDTYHGQGNRYNYCGANPLKYADPSGHCYGQPSKPETKVVYGEYMEGVPLYMIGKYGWRVESQKGRQYTLYNPCVNVLEHQAMYEEMKNKTSAPEDFTYPDYYFYIIRLRMSGSAFETFSKTLYDLYFEVAEAYDRKISIGKLANSGSTLNTIASVPLAILTIGSAGAVGVVVAGVQSALEAVLSSVEKFSRKNVSAYYEIGIQSKRMRVAANDNIDVWFARTVTGDQFAVRNLTTHNQFIVAYPSASLGFLSAAMINLLPKYGIGMYMGLPMPQYSLDSGPWYPDFKHYDIDRLRRLNFYYFTH